MAATQPTFGIHHLTVVPTNFESAADDEDKNEDAVDDEP